MDSSIYLCHKVKMASWASILAHISIQCNNMVGFLMDGQILPRMLRGHSFRGNHNINRKKSGPTHAYYGTLLFPRGIRTGQKVINYFYSWILSWLATLTWFLTSNFCSANVGMLIGGWPFFCLTLVVSSANYWQRLSPHPHPRTRNPWADLAPNKFFGAVQFLEKVVNLKLHIQTHAHADACTHTHTHTASSLPLNHASKHNTW